MKKYTYKKAFACFDCQKSFKRVVNLVTDDPQQMVCPNCGGQAVNLGRNFKPPKSSNKRQRQKVKLLYANGFRFQKIRLKDPAQPNTAPHKSVPYPKELVDVKEFIIIYDQYKMNTINLGKEHH